MPCKAERARDDAIPAANPIHTELVIAATAPEKKAAHNILPSRPMSKIPALSEKSPAMHANSKGVERRRVEFNTVIRSLRISFISHLPTCVL